MMVVVPFLPHGEGTISSQIPNFKAGPHFALRLSFALADGTPAPLPRCIGGDASRLEPPPDHPCLSRPSPHIRATANCPGPITRIGPGLFCIGPPIAVVARWLFLAGRPTGHGPWARAKDRPWG